MIRPVTCVCMLLAGASGLYLYQAKHRVQLLDRQIESTVRATQAARERTAVVKAEWTLLNDPERLSQLAGRFLPLKTVTPGQFTTLTELDNRLPPIRVPGAEMPDQPPLEPALEPVAQAPDPEPVQPATAPKPVPEKAAPAKLAGAPAPSERVPERKRDPAQLAAVAQPARVATRSVVAPVLAASLPRPVPVASYVAQTAASREPVTRFVRGAPAEPALVASPSALGMARTSLPPPVPVSASGYNPGTANGN
jgi:hypothetical protein